MNNHFMLNDDMLWDYADGLLAPDETVKVEAYLRQHPEWQETLRAIQQEKQALFSLPLEKPRADFADRVMAAWAAEQVLGRVAEPAKQKDRMIYVIASVFAVLILAPIVAMIASAAATAPDKLLPANPLPGFELSMLLGSSVLHYATYLAITFALLRFVEKYVQHRQAMLRLG